MEDGNVFEKEEKAFISKMKKNPWMTATIIVGVICIILIILVMRSPATASGVSSTNAGKIVANLYKTVYSIDITVESVKEISGMYAVNVSYQGQNKGVTFISLDGKLVGGMESIAEIEAYSKQQQGSQTQQQTPVEIPKTAKPNSELYIFSYCPAGTAALYSFAQTAKAIGNVADMQVKFFSNMHGEHEKQQNMMQECIQNLSKDKFWDYAIKYVETVYPACGGLTPAAAIDCNKNQSITLMKSLGINSDNILNCVTQKGAGFYEQEQSDANALALQYSPSVVVNGVYDGQADRTPEGLKTLICSAFTTAPSQCSQQLQTTSTASTGSCGA